MGMRFYPHTEDVQKGTLSEKIDLMLEAAGQYKAAVSEVKAYGEKNDTKKLMTPRDLQAVYNWEEIAKILHQIRELPEASKLDKDKKGNLLTKLAEVYEVLRGAKMPKLEAVRLAIANEASQLIGGSSQVA